MAPFNETMCLISGPVQDTQPRVQPPPTPLTTSIAQAAYPLTKSQESMWNQYIANPTTICHNLTLELDLNKCGETQTSISEVTRVINGLTARHAILRSTINTISHKPHHVEYTQGSITPEIRLLQSEDGCISEAVITEMLNRPINLEKEPPVRWVILQDKEEFRVYCVSHHIAVDGHSMSILSKEFLSLLYEPECPLENAVEFKNMHMLERAWTMSPAYTTSRDVMVEQVQGTYHGPWIKSDASESNNTKSHTNYREISTWATLPKSELAEWSKMYKTSWFRVATTLAGLIVADRTRPPLGSEQVVSVGFGSRPESMANCIGQFANALPVKMPLWRAYSSDGSFRSLVAATGKNISSVKKNELFPVLDIAKAVRESGASYDAPRVAITYSPRLANTGCRLFPVNGVWDLFFCFLEYEDVVELGVIYDSNLFSVTDMDNMKTQWEHLVKLSKEDVSLRDMLNWLPEHTSLPKPPPTPQENPVRHIHHWIDAHAQTNPGAIALNSGETGAMMTYHELYVSTEKKAKFLIHKGVSSDDRVVIHLHRGFQTLEWMVAILKSGAAFVYLDIESPESYSSHILENAQAKLLIDDGLVGEFKEYDSQDISDADLANIKYGTSDNDLAYMIYTSGSTGKPKGVMVEHGNVASFVHASTDVFKCGFGTRVLQLASFSFDASILEWTAALCTGGCLCFAENPQFLVGEYLADVIEQNEVSFMEITPTAMETLPMSRSLPSLRLVSMGGEAVSREIFERWHSRFDLVNAYGPTEGAVMVAFHRINTTDPLPEEIHPIHSAEGTKFFICGEDFGPVLGDSRVGEICFSGPQVVRGYCQLPDQTAKSFAIHENGERMYRTGDQGKLLSDGSLVVMGRLDRQIKVRGFRIGPEEIEGAILDAKAGVSEASVLLSEDGKEMIAAVAPESASQDELMTSLRAELPDYKVPSRVIALDVLPKNTSGKLNHSTIRQQAKDILLGDGQAANSSDSLQSESPSEDEYLSESAEDGQQEVGKIWAKILQRDSVPDYNVNFFDIGGHSLLVPDLHSKLQEAFPGKSVRLIEMFHQSTIAQQATLFGAKVGSKAGRAKRSRSEKRSSKKTNSKRIRAEISTDSSERQASTPATSVDDKAPEGAAIVGMAGRYPGASNPDEFYEHLMEGYSGVKPSTINRETLEGNLWVPHAGVLDSIEDFDHEFWSLTKEEATEMDPQHRLFLEVADEALLDAGIDFKTFDSESRSRVGIFVGSANNSYHLYTESVVTDSFLKENRGLVSPSISARTAYQLNMRGPNVTVQTNCSSSTVALSLAYDSLRLGRCDIAIVGGVSVQLFEGGYITQVGQIFSVEGVCRPFDTKADGTVPADAVVAVVLKRHDDAARLQNPIYARILGTGIGSDGAQDKAGYQVPSPRGQADVIKSAWKTAGTSPDALRYAEIHGSGTPIGDALELEGLALAVKELSGGQGKPFTVGSTKGNIGNSQHASGLVSLTKICKSMQAGVIPPTKGLETPNPMINPDLNLDLAMSSTKLKRDDIIAISATGWGGVNSHLVLAFAEEQLQKTSTGSGPSRNYNRQLLKAPRFNESSSTEVEQSDDTPASEIVEAFKEAAFNVLGKEVDNDTDLREMGLDSKGYMALAGNVSQKLSGPSIGITGFKLELMTPTTLAVVFSEKVGNLASEEVTRES